MIPLTCIREPLFQALAEMVQEIVDDGVMLSPNALGVPTRVLGELRDTF
jgi:hypothetical protein